MTSAKHGQRTREKLLPPAHERMWTGDVTINLHFQ